MMRCVMGSPRVVVSVPQDGGRRSIRHPPLFHRGL
jgi:hypothetical protein